MENSKKVQDDTQIKSSKICEIFKMVKNEKGKILIAAGENLVTTKKFDTFDQAERYIGTKPYDLIFNMCLLMINLTKNEKTKKSTKKSTKDIHSA